MRTAVAIFPHPCSLGDQVGVVQLFQHPVHADTAHQAGGIAATHIGVSARESDLPQATRQDIVTIPGRQDMGSILLWAPVQQVVPRQRQGREYPLSIVVDGQGLKGEPHIAQLVAVERVWAIHINGQWLEFQFVQ